MTSGDRSFVRSRRNHRRNDAPVGQKAEEFLATGIAAVRGKTQKAFHAGQRALVDAIARDVLQVEISAARAMDVPSEGDRHRPGIEAYVAGLAPPRP